MEREGRKGGREEAEKKRIRDGERGREGEKEEEETEGGRAGERVGGER